MRLVRFYFHRVSKFVPRISSRLFWHLFTNPRARRFKPSEEKFYHSLEPVQTIKSEEYQSEFTIWRKGKEGKKILVLHGWEGRSSDFSKLIDRLAINNTVYSVDFPGHGKSPKGKAHLPIFVDVIKTVVYQLVPFDLAIGHSLGAASLAIAFGEARLSEQIKSLIFLGLHPEPSQYFMQYRSVTRVNDQVFQRCLNFAERKTNKSLLDYSCYNFLDEYEKSDVHFVHDSDDKIINLRRVSKLNEELPNAQLFHGSHGGHFRHYRHESVIDYIEAVVNEIE